MNREGETDESLSVSCQDLRGNVRECSDVLGWKYRRGGMLARRLVGVSIEPESIAGLACTGRGMSLNP